MRTLLAPIKYLIKTFLFRPYYLLRKSKSAWRFFNMGAIRKYKNNPPALSLLERNLTKTLRKDGIVITHITDLLEGGNDLLATMQREAAERLKSPYKQERKDFWRHLWPPDEFVLSPESPFTQFALSQPVVGIASTYLEMYVRLMAIVGYSTTVMPQGEEAKESQLWHRDPDDKQLCKVFIYLNDVDEDTGPFIYVKGSQNGGRYETLCPQMTPFTPRVARIPDSLVAQEIPSHEVLKCTGRAGTVVFADTTGIHKGGYSKKKERIMLTFAYSSRIPYSRPWSRSKFVYPNNFEAFAETLSPLARYTIEKSHIEIP